MKHCTHRQREREREREGKGQWGGWGWAMSLDVDGLGTWRHVASSTAVCIQSTDACHCSCCHHQQGRLLQLLGCWWRLAVLVLVLHVLWKWAGVTERLEAMLTAERFLTAVQPAVLGQVVLVLERLVTDQTHERTLTWHTPTTPQTSSYLLTCMMQDKTSGTTPAAAAAHHSLAAMPEWRFS